MLLTNIIDNKNYPNLPYKVFTPFMNYQKNNFIVTKPKTSKIHFGVFDIKSQFIISEKEIKNFYKYNKNIMCKGGRNNANNKLLDLKKQWNYNNCRNMLNYQTSRISPYKFRFNIY